MEDELQKVIEDVLAYTAPELVVWKLMAKIRNMDMMIYNGDIRHIAEADYRGCADGEYSVWNVYTDMDED